MDGRTWLLKNTKDQLVMKGHEKGMGPVVAVSTVAATISVCRHESLYMSVKRSFEDDVLLIRKSQSYNSRLF